MFRLSSAKSVLGDLPVEFVLQRDLNTLIKAGEIANEPRDISWLKEQIKGNIFDLFAITTYEDKKFCFGCVQCKTSVINISISFPFVIKPLTLFEPVVHGFLGMLAKEIKIKVKRINNLFAITTYEDKKFCFGCVQCKTSIRDRVTRDREPSIHAMESYFWSVVFVLDGEYNLRRGPSL